MRPWWLGTAALIQGCVYVPRTSSVYDEQCRAQTRQMTLEAERVGGFVNCVNEACVALLIGAGVVTAASVVVSGSIVVVGNVVYWLERRQQCIGARGAADPLRLHTARAPVSSGRVSPTLARALR